MRVFLDANILFSASFPGSHLAKFLHQLQRHADLLTSEYAKAEAQRNISEKLPKNLPAHEAFAASLEIAPSPPLELQVTLAEKDRPILCAAIAGKADFLLTGDKKDFGHLFGKTLSGVKIITVQMLLEELKNRGHLKGI